ncbi:hypothetical protein MKW92_040046 [Papaver armeniacum]|nr:hypothetical protein MKW92_040046 [Papaver armeniacum]
MESLSINSPKNNDLDPWNSINSLDDTHCEEGINAGYKYGLVSGKEEGKQNIKQIKEPIKTYPVFDPENESVQDIMDALRLKFKAISATLSMKLEYGKSLDF